MLDIDPILGYLQSSPQLITSQGLNVRFLKKVVELLPDDMPVNDSTSRILDKVYAVVFHTVSPLRKVLATNWFDEHPYITTGRQEITENDRAAALDLLSSLGLIKPAEPIKRRV